MCLFTVFRVIETSFFHRFCRNLILYPSLEDTGVKHVDQYKIYVREVLNACGDDDTSGTDSSDSQVEKYFGYASFTEMSKRIGQMWTVSTSFALRYVDHCFISI